MHFIECHAHTPCHVAFPAVLAAFEDVHGSRLCAVQSDQERAVAKPRAANLVPPLSWASALAWAGPAAAQTWPMYLVTADAAAQLGRVSNPEAVASPHG